MDQTLKTVTMTEPTGETVTYEGAEGYTLELALMEYDPFPDA